MPLPFRTLLLYIGVLGIVGAGALAFISTPPLTMQSNEPLVTVQTANVSLAEATPIPPSIEMRDEPTYASEPTVPEQQNDPTPPPPSLSGTEDQGVSAVERISNPYPFPPPSLQTINERARSALVNIMCTSGNESLRSISGSGVIIDSRGVILTNAHVAQYVLLSQSPKISLSCVIRSGAPARTLWNVEVLYIPPVWVEEHAGDITKSNPSGTGEYDYALLHITGPSDPRVPDVFKGSYPALPFDTRQAISFPEDIMLVTAYPAEFVGSTATQFDLHPVSSLMPISQLLTFHANTVDLLAFEGAVEAQSGSSGGPVVNLWGYVTGIITTTSDGLTTAERELRAITTSYINRDLSTRAGLGLAAILSGNLQITAANFKANHGSALTELLIDQIVNRLQ